MYTITLHTEDVCGDSIYLIGITSDARWFMNQWIKERKDIFVPSVMFYEDTLDNLWVAYTLEDGRGKMVRLASKKIDEKKDIKLWIKLIGDEIKQL